MLNSQQLGILATHSSTYPHCSLVGYAAVPDCKSIVFATMKNTAKYTNLLQNPNVSMLIDSRTNQETDFKEAQALTVLGNACEESNSKDSPYVEWYLRKLPFLQQFINNPECTPVVIRVSKYILVNGIYDVSEYTIE